LIFRKQRINARLCLLCFIEVLINDLGLRLPESDEVDEIGEYFDQSIIRRFGQVGESKVIDTTLFEL
jgi:hypothetical protein